MLQFKDFENKNKGDFVFRFGLLFVLVDKQFLPNYIRSNKVRTNIYHNVNIFILVT